MTTTRQRRAAHSRARARRRKNGDATAQWVGHPRDSSDLDPETGTGMSRGVEVLLAWLTEHGLTYYQFALANGVDPSAMRRLCTGKRESMSVDMGLKIQAGTNGAVPLEIWRK